MGGALERGVIHEPRTYPPPPEVIGGPPACRSSTTRAGRMRTLGMPSRSRRGVRKSKDLAEREARLESECFVRLRVLETPSPGTRRRRIHHDFRLDTAHSRAAHRRAAHHLRRVAAALRPSACRAARPSSAAGSLQRRRGGAKLSGGESGECDEWRGVAAAHRAAASGRCAAAACRPCAAPGSRLAHLLLRHHLRAICGSIPIWAI